ncbi:MAG TPA: transglycosylase SLT domain-containing protein [Candidatus Binatia bacterium]|nr:transglycosylase SLT domain-containing protein [Candidatus Binatia bacterium]
MARTHAFATILFFSLFSAVPAYAQTAPAPAQAAAPAAPVTHPANALEAVQQGRQMLQDILAARLKQAKQPYRVANANSAKITLAVWQRKTGDIAIVEAVKTGTDLAITSGPKLPIRVAYSAKLSSRYELPAEADALVVGVIYPVTEKKAVAKRKYVYEATDTVYVPYSPAFYLPEMLSSGSDYLSFLIQDAYDELRAKGIRSRAFPDKLLADVIDPYLVKTIAVIEHSDNASFLAEDESESTVGRFLVKLATNRDAAFDASISNAGAAGLVQFIPSTYALMVKKRPDLGLIPDFRTGMADHRNAVKAQVAYLDMDLAGMDDVRRLYLTDKARAAEYLAASYNGGSIRVKRASAAFGDDWSAPHRAELARLQSTAAALKKRIAKLQKQTGKEAKAALVKARSERETAVGRIALLQRSALRQETVDYVVKLRLAYAMFTAGYFATPRAPSGALPALAAATAPAPDAAPQQPDAPAQVAAAPQKTGPICFDDGGCAATD